MPVMRMAYHLTLPNHAINYVGMLVVSHLLTFHFRPIFGHALSSDLSLIFINISILLISNITVYLFIIILVLPSIVRFNSITPRNLNLIKFIIYYINTCTTSISKPNHDM